MLALALLPPDVTVSVSLPLDEYVYVTLLPEVDESVPHDPECDHVYDPSPPDAVNVLFPPIISVAELGEIVTDDDGWFVFGAETAPTAKKFPEKPPDSSHDALTFDCPSAYVIVPAIVTDAPAVVEPSSEKCATVSSTVEIDPFQFFPALS